MKKLLKLSVLILILLVSCTTATTSIHSNVKKDKGLVFLLHALGRSASSMWLLQCRLEKAGFYVESIDYDTFFEKVDDVVKDVSGHTHGGQMFPANLMAGLMFEYNYGLHKEGETQVYVSKGAGTFGPPMRVGTSGVINILNLKGI